MSGDGDSVQEQEWQRLHDRITETLDRFGRKDAFGKGDYWLLDENWGRRRQEIEIQNLHLLRPAVVKALQTLLDSYPNWRITVSVAIPGTDETMPGMGLIVSHDEIVDELQRQYLPEEFGEIRYGDNK